MLKQQQFSEIDLENPFFDSLKQDYKEFSDWFRKKAEMGDDAYVFYTDPNTIDGFLYLKIETEALTDIVPHQVAKPRLKLGTLKINAHGTKLGERFIKKVFDHLIVNNLDEVYVTVFDHHTGLIRLLEKYGFIKEAIKQTLNGTEGVYFKKLAKEKKYSICESYPLLNTVNNKKYLLAIYPQFHSRLLPDSILKNENPSEIIQDISPTNSIHKIYLCKMKQVCEMVEGDVICIYRTSPEQGRAGFLSVMTSLCVVQEYRHINSFNNIEDFLNYAMPYSIFTEYELRKFYNNKEYPYVIRFSYNIAFPKRVIRKTLIDNVGLDASLRWGCLKLSDDQFRKICQLGNINENIIIDQAPVR